MYCYLIGFENVPHAREFFDIYIANKEHFIKIIYGV